MIGKWSGLWSLCYPVCLALLFVQAGTAETLIGSQVFDNTQALSDGSDGIANGVSGGFGPLFDSFTTYVNGGRLAGLQFILAGDPGSTGSIQVGLYSDDNTSPGVLLAIVGTVLDSGLSGSPTLVTVSTPFVPLPGGVRYWIGLSDNSASGVTSAVWSWSSDISGPGVATEYFSNSNGVFLDDPAGPYQMSVTVLPEDVGVPEPAFLTFGAGGACFLLAPLLRRNK